MSGPIVETFEAPAYWASALVNGDDSSFDYGDAQQGARDRAELDAWTRSIAPFYVVDVARGRDGEALDSSFQHWQGLGRDIVEYVAHAPRDSIYCQLRKVRLDSGGYDESGAYWGRGAPLYRWTLGDESGTLRASTRELAKAPLRERFPFVRFYR